MSEFDKGYYSHGPQNNYEAQRGQDWRRLEIEREQQQRAQEQRQRVTTPIPNYKDPFASSTTGGNHHRSGTSPSDFSLQSCIYTCAMFGVLGTAGYGFLNAGIHSWQAAVPWAVKGLIGGSLAGVGIYLVVKVLQLALVVLIWVLKACAWLALFAALIYAVIEFSGSH